MSKRPAAVAGPDGYEYDARVWMRDAREAPDAKRPKPEAAPGDVFRRHAIDHRHFTRLVDWLVDVHWHFKLNAATLHMNVAMFVAYLRCEDTPVVTNKTMQLTGCTAAFLAAKYEEIYPVYASELVAISKKCFTETQLLVHEMHVATALDWRIGPLDMPTVQTFLPYFVTAAGGTWCSTFGYLSRYAADNTLGDCEFFAFEPSAIAASCVAFALLVVAHDHGDAAHKDDTAPWNPRLQRCTTYSVGDLVPCTRCIRARFVAESTQDGQLDARRRRYRSGDRGGVTDQVDAYLKAI